MFNMKKNEPLLNENMWELKRWPHKTNSNGTMYFQVDRVYNYNSLLGTDSKINLSNIHLPQTLIRNVDDNILKHIKDIVASESFIMERINDDHWIINPQAFKLVLDKKIPQNA